MAVVDKEGKFVGFACSNLYDKPIIEKKTDDEISFVLHQQKYKEIRKQQELQLSDSIYTAFYNGLKPVGRKIYV